MMKLKDMRMGTFKGMTALNKKDLRCVSRECMQLSSESSAQL